MKILKEPMILEIPIIWNRGFLYDGIMRPISNKFISRSGIKGLFMYSSEATSFRIHIMGII